MDLLDKKLWLNKHGNTMEMEIPNPNVVDNQSSVVTGLSWKPKHSWIIYKSEGNTTEETYINLFDLVKDILYKACK